jgi:hypothetical protein
VRWSPPIGNGAQSPRSRNAAIQRIALEKLTPNRRAAARQLMPCSVTAQTTLSRKSRDKGPIPRTLLSVRFRNLISIDSGIQPPIQAGRKTL